jgi:hypothetical protein
VASEMEDAAALANCLKMLPDQDKKQSPEGE